MNRIRSLLLATPLVLAAHAAIAADAPAAVAPVTSAPTADLSDAEVRKVDREAKRLTLKHGEIKNLDMPGMTMLFQVRDPAMLDRVKPGDKIRFRAEKIGGAFTVTELQTAP